MKLAESGASGFRTSSWVMDLSVVDSVLSSLFCFPSIFAQALRAAIVAAELPLRGKLRAEATTVFIDQRILEVMKKESNYRQA